MVTEVRRTLGHIYGISAGPDNAIWFIDGQSIERFGLLGWLGAHHVGLVTALAAGDDGNIWFTSESYPNGVATLTNLIGRIGRMTPDGRVTFYTLPDADALPFAIMAGPLQSMWFTEAGADKIGRVDRAGRLTEYALPHKGSHPQNITVDDVDNVWFTEAFRNTIGRLSPNGKIAEFPISRDVRPFHGDLLLSGIAYGTSGKVWFTELATNTIGSMDKNGVVHKVRLAPESGPGAIVYGPDGNMWFVEGGARRMIGRITSRSEVSEYSIPTEASPTSIIVGPDKNLWFSEAYPIATLYTYFPGGIGKVTLH
jgi:virginiamycin B lyase